MKKLISYTTTILIILFFTSSVYYNSLLRKKLDNSKFIIESFEQNEHNYIDYIINCSTNSFNLVNIEKSIIQIIFNKPNSLNYCLLFRYDPNMCKDCIQGDIQNLRILAKKVPKNSIYIIASAPNTREGIIGIQNDLIGFNYIIIEQNMLVSEIDKFELKPFFTLVDSSGKTLSYFFSSRSLPKLTTKYLDHMYENWLATDSLEMI